MALGHRFPWSPALGEKGEPGDDAVTVRERDSQEQTRVPISGLVVALRERLPGCSTLSGGLE